jgi:ureidoglycolate amidohydrolase
MSIGLLVIVVMAMAVIAVEDARICKVPKGEEEGEGIDVAMTEETLFVDGHRLQQQIDELSSFSDTPAPSVTRILFTENDVAARRYSGPQTS